MKTFDWRKEFAPNGYYGVKERLAFETIEHSRSVISLAIDRMERMIETKCQYFFDPAKRVIRITVWPTDIGEDVNHLDPLRPRFGLEIEMRQPVI